MRLLIVIMAVLPWALLCGEEAAPTPAAQSASPPAASTTPAHTPAAPLFTDAEWNRNAPSGTGDGSGKGSAGGLSGASVIGQAAIGLGTTLLIIVGLAYGIMVLNRRYGMRRLLPNRSGAHVQIMETVPLGFKKSVCVIKFHDSLIMVGQGEHELCHLATIPVPETESQSKGHNASNKIAESNVSRAKESTLEGEKGTEQSAISALSSSPIGATPFSRLVDALGGRRP
jgi:flagellar biogenesis protein FliO